jgi:opacity protein-like surface antigen
MRRITLAVFTILFAFASAALAQVEDRHEISLQGTGFFTKDSQKNGISQHSTDSGGLLVGYRVHISKWFAAEADYGYTRNTQQNLTNTGKFNIQSDIHQATGALVVTIPSRTRLRPYALAGAGALIFEPTGNSGGFVMGAERQARPAFVYGGGLEYKISNHMLFRAESRGLIYKRPDFSIQSIDSDKYSHTLQPSAGIVIRF